MSIRYRLIRWLAMGDLIVLNAYFNVTGGHKKFLFSDKSYEAMIRPKYNNQSVMICNCWLDFVCDVFDPSERVPNPVWAWWILRGDGVTDDSRALQEVLDRAGREK